jgi:hypothetical protein
MWFYRKHPIARALVEICNLFHEKEINLITYLFIYMRARTSSEKAAHPVIVACDTFVSRVIDPQSNHHMSTKGEE